VSAPARVRLDPLDPATMRHLPQCEYRRVGQRSRGGKRPTSTAWCPGVLSVEVHGYGALSADLEGRFGYSGPCLTEGARWRVPVG
jgi:hypothetical protein